MNPNDELDPPVSEEERKQAAELRAALESSSDNAEADLLRALSLAHRPHAINAAVHDRILASSLARHSKPKSSIVRVSFGFAAVIALAAGVLLVFRSSAPPPAAHVELVPVRTTANLFEKPFTQSSSARIDRIAIARQNDLRENQFALRGVR